MRSSRAGKLEFGMPEFLLEVGCEELPAFSIAPAVEHLARTITEKLGEAGLKYDSAQTYSTPRRLIVAVTGLPETQEDRPLKKRGPSLSAAYDEAGNPTQALLGFARSNGIDATEVLQEEGNVWAEIVTKGKATPELLSEILPAAILSIPFSKTMRWGERRDRFARPLRWLLAVFDGKTVPVEVAGVSAGNVSYGHRFHSSEPFVADSLESLLRGLRTRMVEPDSELRKERILKATHELVGEQAEISDRLLQENVDLTEWPQPTLGEFPKEYMELPEPVLVTAMAKHERFFPVRDSEGRLESRFVSVRNGGQEGPVRRGNEWVLKARFNDARFYFREDGKTSLVEFREQTRRIAFHEGLGDLHQRSERLAALAEKVAASWNLAEVDRSHALKAGKLSKADLASGLVSELPALQGVIGGEYARRDGHPEEVAAAIAHQYEVGKAIQGDFKGRNVALALAAADHMDKLCGYLGSGLVPSGSQDPFALRRSVAHLVQIAWNVREAMNGYLSLLEEANQLYSEQGIELDFEGALVALKAMMAQRYDVDSSWGHDVQDALVESDRVDLLNPRRVRVCAKALAKIKASPEIVQAATRPINIVRAARKKSEQFSAATIEELGSLPTEHEVERALGSAAKEFAAEIGSALDSEQPESLVEAVQQLQAPIDAYFETVMVMVEDDSIRRSRLSLMALLESELQEVGDFTKLVLA